MRNYNRLIFMTLLGLIIKTSGDPTPFRLVTSIRKKIILKIGLLSLIFSASATYGAIDVNKSFTPAVVTATEVTTVTVTLLNSATVTADNVAFTDLLPADVFIAATPNASTTCGAGVVSHSNSATGGEVSLVGGVIPAGDGTNPGTCAVTIDVYPKTKGTFVNTISIGDVTATNGGISISNTQSTDATLVALLSDLTGSISYSISSGSYGYVQGGETIRTTIQLNNPNNVPLTGLAFSNLLNTYANIVKAVDGSAATTCTGGAVTIADVGASSTVALTNGQIPANGSCEVSFDMIPSRDPTATYYYTARYQTLPVNSITTTQGATNAVEIRAYVYAATGIRIYKYFDNSTAKELNLLNGSTAQLRIVYYNYNTSDVENFSLADAMPTSGATGIMSIDSIDTNTCGGTTNTSTATSLNLTNATLAGATLNAAGIQQANCEVRATVSVNGVGTYTNTIPAGDLAGFNYTATTATLTAVADALKITKAFDSPYFYQGDTRNLIYTFENNTDSVTGVNITDLNFDDDFETPTVFRVATPSSITTTCQNATVNAVANSQLVSISNLTVPKGASCTVTVPVEAATDAYPLYWSYDNVPVGDIEYFINGTGATQTYPLALQSRAYVMAGMRIYKTFTPTVVGPLGVTRLRIQLRHTSYTSFAVDQVAFTDVLPTGHEVASPANVVNECGGTLTAIPGTDTISLTNGLLSAGSTYRDCYVYVNVKVPALSGGLTTQTATNTIPGVPHGTTPLNYTGQKVGAPSGQGLMENYSNASASITRTATSVVVNKEFLPVSINGGGVSRVRVTISNADSAAIDLTQVGLTDDFSGTDLRLHTNVDPTFTDTNGSSSALCRGGTFTGVSGDTSITLANAIVDKNATCRFEFNITASVGGNHINTIDVGDVSSLEGVSNSVAAAATLTVGRQINVGKGFSPTTIASDETSVLTLEFFNTNEAIDEQGESPALIDVMPTGLSVDNIISNDCGGTVVIGTSGGNDTLQLNNGSFYRSSTCRITATVSGTPGTYVNKIAVGDLTTVSGAYNPDPAEATLVIVNKPTITKSFSPTQIAINGTSTVTLRLYNPNSSVALTGASLVDNLTDMVIATPPNVSGTCANRDFTATPGSNQFVLSAATIPAGGNCTVSFSVTSTVAGSHPNQTSGLLTNQTSTVGDPSNEVPLTVLLPLTMTKVFDPGSIFSNQVSKLTFTLTNPNAVNISIGSTGFTDTFPTTPGNMVIANPSNIVSTCGSQVRNLSGSTYAVSGDAGVRVMYGYVPANDSCTVSMDVAVDTAGDYANTTSTLSTVGGITLAASDTLTVQVTPDDYSDAPTASTSYGDATHGINSSLKLGATSDSEAASIANADASGDGADDDGIATFPLLVEGTTTYSVDVVVNNTSGSAATLHAWIDFDGNKSFEADEYTSVVVANNTTGSTETLSWSGLSDVTLGDTFARFRLTTDTLLDVVGTTALDERATMAAMDGEVEDYSIEIVPASKLKGIVFEDINYGGGVGRDQSTASGVGINGVTVELYDDSGAYVSSTVTANDGSNAGAYTLDGVAAGDYFVRVVSDTVGSTRGGANGSELGVQTFRTDGSTATTNEVGGRNPAVADGTAYNAASPSTLNTSTFIFSGGALGGGQAQSLQPITVAATDISDIDFGFNFDTIVNTNDAGQGSLRQFILNSNLLDNTGLDQVDNAADGATDPAAGVETSIFEIPGSGVQVIEPTSGLPAVTDAFTALDATTQQGASCVAGARTLQVQLDGSNAGVNEQGISIDASDAIIRGFAIGEFSEQGIHGSANADNLVVACNNVGLAADGSTLATNGLHGIWIEDATNITIGGSTDTERNIVSGNTRHGINLDGVNGATVQFNYVGTDESGDSARTNNNEGAQYGGVAVIASAANISILDNLISGNDKTSGTSPINATDGIYLYAANTIDIKRNLIGTRADGLAALSNSGHGIYSFNTKNIVVGGSVADRNVISGNGEDGINTRFGTDTVSILSNYIGVAINGTSELGNTDNGIFLADTANAIIGDGTVAGRNVIAGNDISGVRISASGGTTVKGNYIGVDATGMSAIGNSLHGVYVQNSADVVVGGSAANDRNVVSGNGVIGVYMVGATSDTRVENNVVGLLSDGDTIAANGGAGIETSGTNGVVIHDNVASGNGSRGVHLVNSPNTTVSNNLIGLNEAGTADRGNTGYGIDVDTAAVNLAVNGNTIAGNGSTGIRIINGDATNNVITNNRIGVALDGTTGMGNTNGGVLIQSTSGVTVGGSTANESNIIAYNTGDAITVLSSGAKNNIVSRNVMYANTGLGIDLDQDNVTLNDAGDSDSGAGNDGLNFPQFSQITLISGNLTVAGCAPAGATVELFEADVSPTSGSGVSAGSNAFGKTQDYGEGEVFLTAWTMPASGTACALPADADGNDSTGMLAFSQTFALSSLPSGASIVLDDKLTAIATLAGTGTSEFSAIGLVASFDYGDAPLSGTAPSGLGNNNYGITQHAVVSGMSLGSSDPDIDASYQDSALADGDDVNGTDDEDGILLPALVAGDTQYSIVSADITAVGSGTLHAWIDFDGNGTFDADEHSSTAISSGTAGTLNWTMDGAGGNPDFSLAGDSTTFARFRFTSDASVTASTPASIAANGEVEDYAMTILDNTPDVMTRPGVCGGFVSRGWATDAAGILHDNDIRFNSGSAQNDPYAFLALRRQANGKIVTSFGDPDLLETLTGSIPTRAGNNLITTARTDSGHRSEYHATIFRLEGTPGATETVNYDTNGGAEYSAYWVEDAAGNVLSTADFVYTYASGGGIGESFDISVTYPTDGVVYVYSVLFDPTQAYGSPTLLNYTCPTDYSDGLADGLDTPNGTVTASAYGDATHQLLPSIQLGASVTADTASVLAADDASDDAIASFPLLHDAMTSYQIAAADIAATGDGTLTAWIDFDGDGAYQADEFATAEVLAGVVQTDLSWAFSDIMAAGTTYARFRLTTDELLDVAGTTTTDERATLAAIDGEVEDYAITVVSTYTLNGIVFEDINYGGGAGRDQTSASGIGVNGTTVELYDSTGALIATTTTANDGISDGAYAFTNLIDGDYHVRVVSDTINSTRSGSDGSELAVQIFRSDGTTPVTAEVGGRQTTLEDGTAHDASDPSVLDTTSYAFTGGTLDGGQAQSVTPVTLAGADIIGIDFGYNFDTIVNSNDAGQGSLRQFILNSNLLTDEAALAQVGQTAAWETSIFMIPSANLSSGVATIELSSALPPITGSSTAVDGGTQTSNIGNTNAGVSGTGGTVGVDNLTLPQYQNPEVEIDANDFSGLHVESAGEVLIARLAIYDNDAASPLIDKAGVGLTSATKLTIENAFIGPRATGADPGAGERIGRTYDDVGFTAAPNVVFRDSLFAFSENSGLHADVTGGTYVLTGSELHHLALSNSGQDAVDAGGNWTATGNLMHSNGFSGSSSSSGGAGFELGAASNAQVSANSVIENNTLHSNFGPGIRLRNTVSNTLVRKNVIYENLYAGVQVQLRAAGIGVEATISQNSIYNNDELGIDISHNTTNGNPDQVTLNDANDVDSGPNAGLNFPQFTRAVHSGSDLIIQGCAPTGSTVELFEADVSSTSSSGATAGDNSFGKTQDYGEGEVYITSFEEGVDEDSTLAAVSCSGLSDVDGNDATGMSPFQWRMALPAGLQVGDKLTATATLTGTGTSEFSAVAIIAGQDYGDAPSSYNTTLASDGARHDVINNVYLGSVKPDVDSDGQPTVAASGDGTDEDGIASFGALTISDSSYSVVARVNNSASDTATLIAWIDFDRNGRFDADEAAIRTVSAGVSGSDITLNWSSIPLDIQAGDTYMRVRLTTDSLNNREPDGPKLDGEVEDYPITITTVGVTVSGRVFNDANVNAANDSGEVGVTQLPVVLYDTVNKVCVSTRTDGSGAYSFEDVVPGTYQVYEASRESVPVPGNCGPAFAKNPGSYRSTMDNVREAFIVTTSDITGQDFGDVKLPVFEPDNTGQVLPGNVLFYAHKFTTPAKGSVSFSSLSSGNKSSGWSSIIYRDANCDGTLNQSDGAMPLGTGSLAVDATDNICLINKVYAPANVAANDQYVQNITADFDFGLVGTAARDLAGSLALKVRDVTTALQVVAPALPATPEVVAVPVTPVQAPVDATPTTPYIPEIPEIPAQAPVVATPVTPVVGPSRLELRKTVQNTTQNSAETATVNQAAPGDTLKYRIYYSNTGTGPLTELTVNDNAQAFTSIKSNSAVCGTPPAEMTSCTPVISGDRVKWEFVGPLIGGASGVVSYDVVIDD